MNISRIDLFNGATAELVDGLSFSKCCDVPRLIQALGISPEWPRDCMLPSIRHQRASNKYVQGSEMREISAASIEVSSAIVVGVVKSFFTESDIYSFRFR